MSNETKRQNCGRCKVNLTLDKFKKKRDDSYQKNCIECNVKFVMWKNNNKCEHNRQPSLCKECCGSGICEHNRRRSYCKDCKGSQICEHNKHICNCKICKGSSVCEHNRQRNYCKDCKGVSICEHNRQRSNCKDCKGVSICEHNRIRSHCKKCKDPIKLTIKNMINSSKQSDKKHNRYDADRFIDKCFLEGLVKEYPNCYYDDCKVELQYIKYQDDLATIERLDNNIGHIKSNCVICCFKCNNLRKSNM